MTRQSAFRCPFEAQGEREGTIVDAVLGKDRDERFARIMDAFERFDRAPGSPALRFTLAPGLWDRCGSLEALKRLIVPFGSEIVATELTFRLAPFLPYQLASSVQEHEEALSAYDVMRASAAMALIETMVACSEPLPSGPADIARWFEGQVLDAMDAGVPAPCMEIYGPIPVQLAGLPSLLKLSCTAIDMPFETIWGSLDQSLNRNLFPIVQCPFYPNAFGRYAPDVRIVLTRKRDIASLPPTVVHSIRSSANRVHRTHGILIEDLKEDRQPSGLWIPTYVER